MTCEVCGPTVAKFKYELEGTGLAITECQQCRLGVLYPKPTVQEIGSFYPPGYYGSGGKKFTRPIENLVRLVGMRHAKFLAKQIGYTGRVLDVGCGRGVTLRTLNHMGIEAHGFEVSEEAIEGVDSQIQTRIEESLIHANYEANFFDEVIIWHVLEHLPNPREIIAEVQRILKPDGKLIVALPNASSWQARWAKEAWFHLDAPRHLYHFPLNAINKLLELNHFEMLSEHHFSLRQNPYGWIQSCMNRLAWLPHNSLYYLLHKRKHSPHDIRPFSLSMRVQLYSLFLILSPIALLLSFFAALCSQGATVHIVAKKCHSHSLADDKSSTIGAVT